MRTPERATLLGITVGILSALLVAVLIVTLLVVAQIRSVQSTNSHTVEQTSSIVRELKADEADQLKGNATVSQILIEAGAAVKQLEAMEASICKATPGCTLPS